MKNTIIGIIIGVCIAVTGFHIWFLISLSKRVSINSGSIVEIVNFINEAQKASSRSVTAETPPVTK